MSTDQDIVASIKSHIDARLKAQDEARASEFRVVYARIDEETSSLSEKIEASTERKRDLIERYAHDTTAAIQAMVVQVGSLATEVRMQGKYTDERIAALEKASKAGEDRKDGWVRALVIAGLGGIFSVVAWAWSEMMDLIRGPHP